MKIGLNGHSRKKESRIYFQEGVDGSLIIRTESHSVNVAKDKFARAIKVLSGNSDATVDINTKAPCHELHMHRVTQKEVLNNHDTLFMECYERDHCIFIMSVNYQSVVKLLEAL